METPMIDSRVIQNLESFGDRYCDRYLRTWHDIAENWWTAFRFFFGHAFMRGRRDQLSEEYFQFAMSVLKRYFGIPDKPKDNDFVRIASSHDDLVRDLDDIIRFKKRSGAKLSANSVKLQPFHNEIVATHPLVKELVAKTAIAGQRPLNNDKDLLMVLSALAFLARQGMPANVHNYMVERLRLERGAELTKALEEIYFVGDKLSSFIIRDMILMNPELAVENNSLVFPIDTWVLKIARRFGCKSEDHNEVRAFFISQLRGRSAAKVAAGAWYLGFHSLEIILANLERVDMTSPD